MPNLPYIVSIPIIYIGLFLLFSALKGTTNLGERIIFCSVCFAWATHLILAFVFNYPNEILAYMFGLTITGLAYKIHENIKVSKDSKEIKRLLTNFFFLQLILTIIGLIIILYF